MKIAYITSNNFKFAEAQHVLAHWELCRHALDLTEIQGSPEQIIEAKAREASRQLHIPLIVEDVSFCCSALHSLPGPYIKDFLAKISDAGVSELIHHYQDRSCEVICYAAYIEPSGQPKLFKGSIQGQVVAPRGFSEPSFTSWNAIFQPSGMHKTFAELTIQEQSRISMRYKALTQLRDYLEQN